MSIELWGSDEAGHLMLLPDPSPERTEPRATATPPGEPPLAQDPAPAREPAPPPEPTHADELKALRTMIEQRDQERAAREAQRDTQVQTIERLVRGEDLTPPKDAKPAAPVEPKAEDFEDHETFVRAAARFEAKQEVDAERQARQQAEQQTQQRQQLLSRDQSVKQLEDAFVADHPDYVDVVTKGLVAKAPPAFREVIMLLDDAPAVAYQLAQDEALLGRLLAMPPGPLFYALGRLSASAGGGTSAAPAEPPAASTPQVRSAPAGVGGNGSIPPVAAAVPPAGRAKPAPPRPLGGSGANVPTGYDDGMSMDEYRTWRKARAS